MSKIHTTVGLYPSGDYKVNGVDSEDLQGHIDYNTATRFGRALFVDGKCVYKGLGVTPAVIAKFEKTLKEDQTFIRTECTAPYH